MIFISCSSDRKFSTEEWVNKDDFGFSPRPEMVKDLLDNYLNKKLSYRELIILLGTPDAEESTQNTISYITDIEYEWLGVDPIKVRYLDLVFDKDSILVNSQIGEWNKK